MRLSALPRLLGLLVALTLSVQLRGQNNYVLSLLSSEQGVRTCADLRGHFFFLNDEYFAPQVEGYTLGGYVLRPTIEYAFTPSFSLTGGLQWLQYGGLEHVHYVSPFFAAKWQINEVWLLRMGSLPGVAAHGLSDEVQNVEGQVTERPELGVRLLARRDMLEAEAWVNWRQFIFRGDTIPEKFTAGLRVNVRSGGEQVRFEGHSSLVFDHIGGQISDYSEPMQSLATFEATPAARMSLGDGYARSLAVSLRTLFFHTMAGKDVRPFADGWALHPEVAFRSSLLEIGVGYFYAKDFYAPHGNSIYWSVSDYDATVYESKRSLLTASFALNKQVAEGVRFSLEGKCFHDTKANRLDYSYGFSLAFDLISSGRFVR